MKSLWSSIPAAVLPLSLAGALTIAAASCNKDDTTSTSPALTLGSTTMTVSYEGGTFSVACSLTNAADGSELDFRSAEDWIYDLAFEVEDTLSFTVAPYSERIPRSSVITFDYISGADTLITKTLTVIQELNNHYSLDASFAEGCYYGLSNIYNNEGNLEYCLYLSDTGLDAEGNFAPGGTYYYLDLWTAVEPDGTNDVSLPDGKYIYGAIGENGVLSSASYYCLVSEDGDTCEEDYGITGGSLSVSTEDGTVTITAFLEDANGGNHDLTYSGPLTLENMSLLSTLDEDCAFGDFSTVACEARYYGDYYSSGTANWLLLVYPETDGSGFTIDLCGDADFTFDSGCIPTGTFTASSEGGPANTFLTGGLYANYLSGTWFVTMDSDGKLTSPYAPITGGTIEISGSTSVTITISLTDDRGNAITASWTGAPTISDYTTSKTETSAAASLSSRASLTSKPSRLTKLRIPFRIN